MVSITSFDPPIINHSGRSSCNRGGRSLALIKLLLGRRRQNFWFYFWKKLHCQNCYQPSTLFETRTRTSSFVLFPTYNLWNYIHWSNILISAGQTLSRVNVDIFQMLDYPSSPTSFPGGRFYEVIFDNWISGRALTWLF